MEKVTISISSAFLPEKQYILEVIFGHFFDIPFVIDVNDINKPAYIIYFNGIKSLVFNDAFFSKFDENTGYLSESAIPISYILLKNEYLSEADLPVLFGNDNLNIKEENDNMKISCGADIFASAFFFLSRWEEIPGHKSDEHGRFPDTESFLQKNKLQNRPLVNEYLEFLWALMLKAGYKGKRKQNQYKVTPTHDIDYFKRYNSFSKIIGTLLGDLIKRRSFKLLKKNIAEIYKCKIGKSLDPFDKFDFFIYISEKNNLTSVFFFIPSLAGEKYSTYNIYSKDIEAAIRKIIERNHKVGIHASYLSFADSDIFLKELNRLRKIHPDVSFARQHYLRFKTPVTWQIMADAGIEISSNMSFSNNAGFRTACCYDYPVFNVLTRKKLKLIELPLVMMDAALIKEKAQKDNFFSSAVKLAKTVKKYRGNFVFLWHNSSFSLPEWEKIGEAYTEFVNEIAK